MTRLDDLLAWLRRPESYGLPAGETVDVCETPGAWVFLAADRAFKVKKPVDLGFLDFSTLEKRWAIMKEELEINRRTAPDYYLRIAEITEEPGGGFAFDGAGGTVEVALVMKRFDQDRLLSRVAARDGVSDDLAERLGAAVAAFHREAIAAGGGDRADGAAAMIRHAEVNAASLRENAHVFAAGAEPGSAPNFESAALCAAGDVEALIAETDAATKAQAPLFDARAAAGWMQRLHADLHLENIFLGDDGAPVLFDAIEFDPALATMDVMLDLGFLLMDLIERGQPRAANRVLNVWIDRMARLDAPAVYEGLALLPLCVSSRAAVRAHVRARLAAQSDPPDSEKAEDARAYMALARKALAPATPRLIAIGGRSGTGKSTIAKALAPDAALFGGPVAGAVIVRTDEVRKRLFGVAPLEPLPREAYTDEAHARVYAACFEAAGWTLGAGASVILDAAFLDPAERAAAEQTAATAGVAFAGLWLDAPEAVLIDRVSARAGDASDADAEVVRGQFARDVGEVTWACADVSGTVEQAIAAARKATER
ncbi:MAG: AAA family ATPase [Maricaulaceae bacterium]|jgi:hypothetical protein